jgi:hypothetical protein
MSAVAALDIGHAMLLIYMVAHIPSFKRAM